MSVHYQQNALKAVTRGDLVLLTDKLIIEIDLLLCVVVVRRMVGNEHVPPPISVLRN